ncbi:Ig-like domain-containing protein [Paenibacillus ginsengarvi]|uniref:BIG2 domain-containing protein n=1 Tax=Paenibacillus ginsengarvi TaxID=400777 RepID=A0A3B0CI78_9BACL|nr:Ig-like domain-containing protein [Paenibacillus ginsengarvi]RKN83706.1 hypothetical protein D7M11_16005 [Paenibacillus ginsengarvi]
MFKLGRWTKSLLVSVLLFGLLPGWNAGVAEAEGQAPGIEWERQIEGSVRVIDVQPLSNGGYTTMGAVKEGELYLDRTDAQGNKQWSKTVTLTENDKNVTVESVQHTRDGGYIVGGTITFFHWRYRDYYIAKLDGNGDIQWKIVDSAGAYGSFQMIRETNDGGFIYVEYTESMNAGFFSTSAIKIDSSGNKEWTKVLGGGRWVDPDVAAQSVRQTADDGYMVGGFKAGSFSIWKLDAAGTIEWNRLYPVRGGYVVPASNGGYAIAGTGASGENVIIMTDSSGAQQWTKTWNGGQTVSLDTTKDGGYLVGTNQNAVKTDGNASTLWTYSVSDLSKAISTDDGGTILVRSPNTIVKLAGPSAPPQGRLKLDSMNYSLAPGQTIDTVLKFVYSGGQTNVTRFGAYSVAEPAIASVDASGNIKGLMPGQTVLTATYNGLQTKANVYIYGGGTQNSLKFDSSEYSLSVGQSLDTVVSAVYAGQTSIVTGQTVYSVGDPSVASIDTAGVITGLKRGMTALTATYNGMKATAKAYVY